MAKQPHASTASSHSSPRHSHWYRSATFKARSRQTTTDYRAKISTTHAPDPECLGNCVFWLRNYRASGAQFAYLMPKTSIFRDPRWFGTIFGSSVSQEDMGVGGKGSTGQLQERRSVFKGNVRLGRHYFLVSDTLCLAQTNSLWQTSPRRNFEIVTI